MQVSSLQDRFSQTAETQNSSAFLIFTNVLTERVLRQITTADAELAGRCDVHIIGYFTDPSEAPEPFQSDLRFHAYDKARMEAFDYPVKGRPFQLMPGNTDMPILAFSQDHPHYETIWLFENDVAFTGPLSSLVDAFAQSSADLITTNIAPPPVAWSFMHMNVAPDGWPADLPKLRAFLPALRVSHCLLQEVDRFYREGGNGHYEYSWTYVARACSLSLEDFGGRGEYVKPGNRNRYYSSSPEMSYLYPGSFRYRPAMNRPGRRRLRLWHPIKEDYNLGLVAYFRLHAWHWLRWLLLPAERR